MTKPKSDLLQGAVGLIILKILAIEPMRRSVSEWRLLTAIERILQAF
jgi:hypothetical protein